MEYFKEKVTELTEDLAEARDLLDIRTRDTASLRQAMQHIERDLLQRLAAAAPLTEQDQAVLLAAADKLMLAGSTFAGLGSNEHARASNHLMAQVLDIADRIKKAQANAQPHPDTDLLDWLDVNALVNFDLETAELRFPAYHPTEAGYDTLRDLLREAMANNEAIDRNHGELLQAAAAQEATA